MSNLIQTKFIAVTQALLRRVIQAAHIHKNQTVLDQITSTSGGSVTKQDVESVLTGEITSHTHPGGSGGLTQAQALTLRLL